MVGLALKIKAQGSSIKILNGVIKYGARQQKTTTKINTSKILSFSFIFFFFFQHCRTWPNGAVLEFEAQPRWSPEHPHGCQERGWTSTLHTVRLPGSLFIKWPGYCWDSPRASVQNNSNKVEKVSWCEADTCQGRECSRNSFSTSR